MLSAFRCPLPRMPRLVGASRSFSRSPPARAFERQWHLGGGVGAAVRSDGYDIGPALGVHGAYGILGRFRRAARAPRVSQRFRGLPVSFYASRLGLATSSTSSVDPVRRHLRGRLRRDLGDISTLLGHASVRFSASTTPSHEHFGVGVLPRATTSSRTRITSSPCSFERSTASAGDAQKNVASCPW